MVGQFLMPSDTYARPAPARTFGGRDSGQQHYMLLSRSRMS